MKKSVHFATEEDHIPIDMLQASTQKDSANWYQPVELEKFKNNAYILLTKIKKKRKLEKSYQYGMKNDNIIGEESCTRGLELCIDKERKKRKYCAKRIIIEAQKSIKGCDLAHISSSLSSWARENAIKDAKADELAISSV